MTHIVSPNRYLTKKAFKEAVLNDPSRVYVDDPSVFDPVSGTVLEVITRLAERGKRFFTVTNHPKRSWFAQVERTAHGTIKVS